MIQVKVKVIIKPKKNFIENVNKYRSFYNDP